MAEDHSERIHHAVFQIMEMLHGSRDLNNMYISIRKILEELPPPDEGISDSGRSDMLKTWLNVDHRLRTAMFGILGFSEILQEELKDTDARWKVEQIIRSARQMNTELEQAVKIFIPGERLSETDTEPDINPVPEQAEDKKSRQRPKSAGKVLPKVLIVEDNIVNLNLLMIYIRKYCHIFSTKNARSAIELVQKEKIDAILMDIHLGEGMNGIQAMHEIRKQPGYEQIPIIAVTAYAGMGARDSYLREGFTEFISKPINRAEIREVMEKLFR